MLTFRDMNDDPILRKASDIVTTKLAGSTLLQDAAVKLIQTCKIANDRPDSSAVSAGRVKEIAKQLYSIKATDVSLDAAGVKSPKACNPFCDRSQTSWFGAGYFSVVDADDFIDPAVAHDRSVCLKELYKVDNTWTSYSNHLQDANSLCEISSVEHAPRMMLELLKDMTEVVPSMIEMFRQQKTQHEQHILQMQQHGRDLGELHRKQLQDNEDQHEAAKEFIKTVLEKTKTNAQEMTSELRTDLLAVGGDVVEIQRVSPVFDSYSHAHVPCRKLKGPSTIS